MNRLEIAQSGYDSFAAALSTLNDEVVADRVEQWLSDDVCQLMDELVLQRRFRSTTLWSVTKLCPTAETSERRIVMEVDRGLVAYAKAIRDFIVAAEEEIKTANGIIPDFVSQQKRTVDYIANRPWFDLACAKDFFRPNQDLHLDSEKLNHEHTQAFRKREIRIPLGDYITRFLLARVDYWMRVLDGIRNSVHDIGSPGTGASYQAMGKTISAKFSLDDAVKNLVSICEEPTHKREREACIALTLIYCAYSRRPNLGWLGRTDSCWDVYGSCLRSIVRRKGTMQTAERSKQGILVPIQEVDASLCDPDVIRQIASSLHDMTRYYGTPDDPNEVIEEAVYRAMLVLVDHAHREVWFDGKQIDIVWDKYPKPWDLLWKLATKPNGLVDHEMLSSCSQDNLRIRRNRLAKLLDGNLLDTKIVSSRSLGYKLVLDAAEVVLLQDDGSGVLKEVFR